MEMPAISWVSSLVGLITFGALWIGRSKRLPSSMVENLGWAALGGFGVIGTVQASYPIYRFVRYHSLKDIPNLENYVLIGCGIACAAGVIAVIKAWKA